VRDYYNQRDRREEGRYGGLALSFQVDGTQHLWVVRVPEGTSLLPCPCNIFRQVETKLLFPCYDTLYSALFYMYLKL
jgi:hypothetical protein